MPETLAPETKPTEGQAAPATAATPSAGAPPATKATEGQTQPTAAPATGKDGKPGSSKEGDAGKPQGAPEKYEFKAPEGREFTPEVITAFESAVRKANLPQEAAQQILDTVSPVIASAVEAMGVKALDDLGQRWEAEARADKEFGGTNLDANLALARKVLDKFGDEALATALKETRFGSNPALLRWAWRIGKAISPDGFVSASGASASAAPKTTEEVLYGDTNVRDGSAQK